MSAPKKIWVIRDRYVVDPEKACERIVPYIRADLVDGLVGALEYMLNVCPPIDTSGEDAHEKARAALKAMEEE